MQTQEFHVLKEWTGKNLQEVISLSFFISKGAAKKLIDSKQVFVNDKRIWMARHTVKSGDIISLAVQGTHITKAANSTSVVISPKNVVYKDAHILVINKPPGITANGRNSAESILQAELEDSNIKAVHRLDRDTSGCLIFSRSQEAWDGMFSQFKNKSVAKIYHALCVGTLTGKERDITTPIEGREACSHVKLLKQLGDIALVEVIIETGRTHQIRKHLLSINLPVLGDKDYYSKQSESKPFRGVPRQMLHAYQLGFIHPITGQEVTATSPYSPDFADILRKVKRST